MSNQDITPKVGDSIWVFDINHREYRRDANGRSAGGPIWRKHWVERRIVGETSRSFDLGYYGKCPKKRDATDKHTFAFSIAEIDQIEWAEEHGREIARLVQYGRFSIEQLKQIAEIIGYKPEEQRG